MHLLTHICAQVEVQPASREAWASDYAVTNNSRPEKENLTKAVRYASEKYKAAKASLITANEALEEEKSQDNEDRVSAAAGIFYEESDHLELARDALKLWEKCYGSTEVSEPMFLFL